MYKEKTSIEEHRAVQAIAKSVLSELGNTINPADTECTIANKAVNLLATRGITETWYHECPALVLLGSRSCLSISGRQYQPNDEEVGQTNLITVDDSMRTFVGPKTTFDELFRFTNAQIRSQFTFEPHIRAINGVWGFKQEDIYYFSADDTLQEL